MAFAFQERYSEQSSKGGRFAISILSGWKYIGTEACSCGSDETFWCIHTRWSRRGVTFKRYGADATVAEASNSQPAASTYNHPSIHPRVRHLSLHSSSHQLHPPSPSQTLVYQIVARCSTGRRESKTQAIRVHLEPISGRSTRRGSIACRTESSRSAVEKTEKGWKAFGPIRISIGSTAATHKEGKYCINQGKRCTNQGKRGISITAAPASARPTTTVVSAAPVDPFFRAHQEVDASFNETAPVPTPGTPYLQSGRLFPPNIEGHAKLKKSTLKQMDEILSELGVPKEPIPTKRSCDLFDGVRKDAMTLLILQKMALRKRLNWQRRKPSWRGGLREPQPQPPRRRRGKTKVQKRLPQKAPNQLKRRKNRLRMQLLELLRIKQHRKRRERIRHLPPTQQQWWYHHQL
ncbi:DNA methyltransferase 1-associated protein 1 [Skeletonema marinoi]|uniref:DNA methyltransferase 1-associated protein 1 n=1 Tax=Skeletonema marinoi TaxID=267567 RepID=A0AAD9DF04_9STRA|nr:DNA methyltransferase 1-associated protein 1 [Skeletonema marinoi]